MSKPTKNMKQNTEDNHLSLPLMQKYLEENLSENQMHQIERHLLDCELCADAIEGLTFVKDPEQVDDSVNYLKRKIRKRSLREPVLKRKKQKTPLLWRHMSIAAATIILVVGSILVFKLKIHKPAIEPISLTKAKEEPSSAPVLPEVASPSPAYSDALPLEETKPKATANAGANSAKSAPQALTLKSSSEKTVTESDAGLAPEVAIDQIEEELKDKEAIVLQEEQSLRSVPPLSEAKREEAPREVLSGKRAAPSNAIGITQNFITITGKVVAASDTNVFLPGTKVNIKGTNTYVMTDYRGRFSLATPPKSTLVFSLEGMNSAEVIVMDRKPIQVLLKREGTEEAEEKPTEEIIEEDNLSYKPQPENGLMSYRNYLKKNLQYPAEARKNNIQGNVRVEFTVKANGQLADFSVKKGLGYGCDQEALRLIKVGPAWKPAVYNGKKVDRKITVYVPFKL
jgi:TonB family protein